MKYLFSAILNIFFSILIPDYNQIVIFADKKPPHYTDATVTLFLGYSVFTDNLLSFLFHRQSDYRHKFFVACRHAYRIYRNSAPCRECMYMPAVAIIYGGMPDI